MVCGNGKDCPLSTDRPHHGDHRHQLLDRLADAFEDNVTLGPLLS